MARQSDVDELGRKFEGAELVENDIVEKHLKEKNYDLAFTVYQVHMEHTKNNVEDNNSSGNNSAKNASIVYGEGGTKVSAETVDLKNALNIDALTAEQIRAKAKAKAANKAKREKEHGERE